MGIEIYKTEHWIKLKNKVWLRANSKCEQCQKKINRSNEEGHVHHKTYQRAGNELLGDVKLLCLKCHGKQHNLKFYSKKERLELKAKKDRLTEERHGSISVYNVYTWGFCDNCGVGSSERTVVEESLLKSKELCNSCFSPTISKQKKIVTVTKIKKEKPKTEKIVIKKKKKKNLRRSFKSKKTYKLKKYWYKKAAFCLKKPKDMPDDLWENFNEGLNSVYKTVRN